MKLFIKLIINEMYKFFFQKKTIAFFVVIVCLLSFFAYVEGKNDVTNWRKDTEQRIVDMQKEVENIKNAPEQNDERKLEGPGQTENMNKSMIEGFQNEIKLLQYRLDHDIPDHTQTPLRFVYSAVGNIAMIIILYVIVFTADIIAGEFSGGTIRQILVKPVKRWKLFLAKFTSSVLVNIALFLFFLIAASIIGFILYSGNSSTIYDVRMVDGEIEKINMIRHLSLELLSQIFSAVIISTITFLIATITRKSALATVVSFVVFFGGGMISEFFREYWFYKYLITQNFQLSVFLTKEWLPYEGATFGTSLFICLVYSFVFFTAGLLIFNKRDVY